MPSVNVFFYLSFSSFSLPLFASCRCLRFFLHIKTLTKRYFKANESGFSSHVISHGGGNKGAENHRVVRAENRKKKKKQSIQNIKKQKKKKGKNLNLHKTTATKKEKKNPSKNLKTTKKTQKRRKKPRHAAQPHGEGRESTWWNSASSTYEPEPKILPPPTPLLQPWKTGEREGSGAGHGHARPGQGSSACSADLALFSPFTVCVWEGKGDV